jgi:hypothetical protein
MQIAHPVSAPLLIYIKYSSCYQIESVVKNQLDTYPSFKRSCPSALNNSKATAPEPTHNKARSLLIYTLSLALSEARRD